MDMRHKPIPCGEFVCLPEKNPGHYEASAPKQGPADARMVEAMMGLRDALMAWREATMAVEAEYMELERAKDGLADADRRCAEARQKLNAALLGDPVGCVGHLAGRPVVKSDKAWPAATVTTTAVAIEMGYWKNTGGGQCG